ncbi:MAG: hypothetical protein ACM3ZC_00605 [Bacteroidota bacterium]
MNILPIVVAALVMGASIFGFGLAAKATLPKETAPKEQVEQPVVENEEDIVRKLVEDFGKKLQLVSLSASPEIAGQSIQENYSAFISPALLSKWLRDPQKAPGRMVSSPWPDRIEVSSLTKVAESLYKVSGNIVEITSVEKANGGSAATRPVILMVKKMNGRFLIDEVTAGAEIVSQAVIYRNTRYGFEFSLPEAWRGYSIVTDKWVGNAIGDARIVETGPLLSIRHPNWTAENPRQDIPIMVFTLAQWTALQQERFHIGAAPIPPSELGRNRSYVFALPARYNFAFPTGFEEVEAILKSKPLTPLE